MVVVALVGAVGVFWALTFIIISLILTLKAADGRVVLHVALEP
jgi:hypothetical protein